MKLIKCWRCHKIYNPQTKTWLKPALGDSLDNLESSIILKAIGVKIEKIVVEDNDSCPICSKETGGIKKSDV